MRFVSSENWRKTACCAWETFVLRNKFLSNLNAAFYLYFSKNGFNEVTFKTSFYLFLVLAAEMERFLKIRHSWITDKTKLDNSKFQKSTERSE